MNGNLKEEEKQSNYFDFENHNSNQSKISNFSDTHKVRAYKKDGNEEIIEKQLSKS